MKTLCLPVVLLTMLVLIDRSWAQYTMTIPSLDSNCSLAVPISLTIAPAAMGGQAVTSFRVHVFVSFDCGVDHTGTVLGSGVPAGSSLALSVDSFTGGWVANVTPTTPLMPGNTYEILVANYSSQLIVGDTAFLDFGFGGANTTAVNVGMMTFSPATNSPGVITGTSPTTGVLFPDAVIGCTNVQVPIIVDSFCGVDGSLQFGVLLGMGTWTVVDSMPGSDLPAGATLNVVPTPLGAIISIVPASTPIGPGLREVVVLTVNAPSGSTPLMVMNPSAGCSNSAINGMDGVLTCAPPVLIIAGDADATGSITIGDAILSLSQLFPPIGGGTSGAEPFAPGAGSCTAALDCNSDNLFNIADPIYLLAWLFSGGPPPPAWGGGLPSCHPASVLLGCLFPPGGCP